MNKAIIFIIAVILLTGCAAKYAYLSAPKKVTLNPFGSYIKVYTGSKPIAYGELLAIEGDTLIIRAENIPYLRYVDTTMVSSYYIQYCNPKSYGYLPLISFSHGWWLIFTFPINAVVALVLAEKEKKDTRYFDLPFSQVSDFARFPQGLPAAYRYEDIVYPEGNW